MKALSLWQPWASLWCSKRKVHETRHWRCSHRGWLLVHAGKHFEKTFELDDPLRLILDDEFGGDWAKDLPTGALIGMVMSSIVDRRRRRLATPQRATMTVSVEIFRRDASPGNAMTIGYSTSQFGIGALKVSSACPTT